MHAGCLSSTAFTAHTPLACSPVDFLGAAHDVAGILRHFCQVEDVDERAVGEMGVFSWPGLEKRQEDFSKAASSDEMMMVYVKEGMATLSDADETKTVKSGQMVELSERSPLLTVLLPNSLHHQYGTHLFFPVGGSSTGNEIKGKLSDRLGLEVSDQTLLHEGSPLSTYNTPLGSLGIRAGGPLTLTLSDGTTSPSFSVKVALPPSLQAMFGLTLTVAGSPAQLVHDLKYELTQLKL